MSLRAKVLLIVLGVVSLYALLDYASQYFLVLPSFISLERNEAQNTMRRCVGALRREITNLDKAAKHLAESSDTYRLITERNDDSIDANFAVAALANKELDLICIRDRTGEVVWGRIRDPQTDKTRRLHEPATQSKPGNPPMGGLDAEKILENSTAGVAMVEGQAMLVASRPVPLSRNEGPGRCEVITGRFLNDSVVKAITEQVPVQLKMWTAANTSIPREEKAVFENIKAQSQFHIRELSDDFLQVYTVVCDTHGAAVLLMRADITRDIRAKAIAGFIRSGLFSNLAAGLSVVLVLFVLLQTTVIGPIGRLTSRAVRIRNGDNASAKLILHRSDEIGTLAREFNNMVEQLAESRRRLSEQSYYLGKAEVASGVLHNARNVLTPLVSRIDNLRQKLRNFPIEKVELAQAELAETMPSKGRREALTKLINLANESLVCVIREMKDRLDKVAKQVAQIEEIVTEQGKFTHPKSAKEEVKLNQLVGDSIDLLPNDFCDTISFQIDPSLEATGPVRAHSVTLLQVFNNILLNAAESIRRSGATNGQISIRAETEYVAGVEMAHVRISDNGEGMEPGKLKQIFERGFSTRCNVASGTGLHWCANALAKMNGRIYAESEGKGRGACLHILLPHASTTMSLRNSSTEAKS